MKWLRDSRGPLLGALLLTSAAHAQEDDLWSGGGDDLFSVLQDQVKVTSVSKRETSVDETPQSVYVITSEDIRGSGALSVGDVLRLVPGLDVAQYSSSMYEVNGRFRQLYLTNKLQVIVDNRSMYVDAVGLVPWQALPVNLSDIERVEVVLGPSSTLYGANAFTGVVNIITKRPGKSTAVAAKLAGGTKQSGLYQRSDTRGFLSSSLAELSANPVVGPVSLRISVGARHEDPSNQVVVPFARGTRTSCAEGPLSCPDSLRGPGDLRAVLRSSYTPSENTELHLGAMAVRSNGLLQTFSPAELIAVGSGVDSRWTQRDVGVSGGQLEVFGGWRRIQANSTLWVSDLLPILPVSLDESVTNFGAQYAMPITADLNVVSGVDLRLVELAWDAVSKEGRRNTDTSAFLNADYRVFDRLTLGAGLRGENRANGRYPGAERLQFSPRASAVLRVGDNHFFRANLASAFRNPTSLDEFVTLRAPVSGSDLTLFSPLFDAVPGREVRPERITSFELGYTTRLDRTVRLQLNAFRSVLTGLIDFGRFGPEPLLLPYASANADGTQHHVGGEALVVVSPLSWLSSSFGYSFVHKMAYRSPEIPTELLRFADTPEHHAYATVTVKRQEGVILSTQAYYVSDYNSRLALGEDRIHAPSSLIVNARAAYSMLDGSLELSASGFNLFLQQSGPNVYGSFAREGVGNIPDAAEQPGRRFMLGLDYRFE